MIILGHRGGRGAGWPPENSLEAFARAFDEGAAGVELDVRLCASGEPVLHHDPTLPPDVAHPSRQRAKSSERGIHLIRREHLPLLEGGVRIPTLGEALDLCRDRSGIVNVEVKADSPRRVALIRAVAREVQRARPGLEVVISSFDPALVLAFAAALPRVPRAMLVGKRTPRLATALPLAIRRVVIAAHLEDSLVTKERVLRLHRSGLRVVAWTVNDDARTLEMRDALKVDWVITDQPGQMVKALDR